MPTNTAPGRPAPGHRPAVSAARRGLADGPAKIRTGLVQTSGRRLTKWHLLGIAVLAFGLAYGVCRLTDALITSDEERIVALLESIADRARKGELERLLEDVRLADYGFSVGGWGEVYSWTGGQEDKLLVKVREWSGWASVRSLRIKLDEEDVQVEGDRARASADLLFEEDKRPWRQPVHVLFRKGGDRWYVTKLDVVRPDEILRP